MKLGDLWKSNGAGNPAASDTTGAIGQNGDIKPNAGLLGSDPNDDLNVGKKLYRAGAFGLAERSFRRAVEQQPNDAEAWIGLAACYDRLKRFDLADRAYAQAIRIVGPTAEVLNNQGFSYILRGDFTRARNTLHAARARDPQSPYIQANLQLLEESIRKGKAVRSE